ncbi:MAG TPA: HAMP domain-containing sensor histidine kinase [Candidatus Binatia bacterium]|nr:HAMP domain-containing sensor histidine kinase [Candidatus Binatia bacterium]
MTEPGVAGPPVPGPLASSPAIGTDAAAGPGIVPAPDLAVPGAGAGTVPAQITAPEDPLARPAGPDAPLLRRTRRRLVAWSAATMLVALLILGVAIYGAVASSLAATSQGQLEQRAAGLQRFIANAPGMPDRFGNQPDVGISFGGPAPNTIAMIVTPSGTVIGPQSRIQGLPDQAAIAVALTGTTDVRTIHVQGIPLRLLTEPVDRNDGTVVLQVAQDISSEEGTLNTLLAVLIFGGVAAVVAAVVGGWFYAQRALVPIRDSLRRQREFTADASHELRTPLTVIRATVEHLERHPERTLGDETESLEDVRAGVDHLTALVGDLLLLARTDSGIEQLSPEPLDLSEIATEAVDSIRPLATERNVQLVVTGHYAPLTGDRTRLRQLVTILTDNAIRHGPAGGTVNVTVEPRERGGAGLTVDDQGPGIRPEDRDHVFDRFWRAPGSAAGGTGLGLAIAAWVVERHGGTIEVGDAPGGGARFEARLAAHPPA